MSNVEIKGLTKRFPGGVVAIDDLDMSLHGGEMLVLLGPSGCGKTTLLRCLGGLERPDYGEITVDGRMVYGRGGSVHVPTHKRQIGMVFQNYALWPHLDVRRNVEYPLRVRGMRRAERRIKAAAALDLVECGNLAARYPAAISGGQQQRIALARALVAEPRLILFDEPLSNLDYRLRGQLKQQIRELHRVLGFTGLYVTHDQTEAMQIGSQVAVLKFGKIEQLGPPDEIYQRPATAYVARFLGINTSLKLRRADGRWSIEDQVQSSLAPSLLPADEYDLFVRGSDVHLAAPDEPYDGVSLRGRVLDVVFGGEQVEWLIEASGQKISAIARAGTWPFAAGDAVQLRLPISAMLAYEPGEGSRLSTPLRRRAAAQTES